MTTRHLVFLAVVLAFALRFAWLGYRAHAQRRRLTLLKGGRR